MTSQLDDALIARATAVHPNCIVITRPVSCIAPGVLGAERQSVGLNPSAPTVDCLYILSEIDLICTGPYSFGGRSVATEAAPYAAVGVDRGCKEHDPSLWSAAPSPASHQTY
jgi:hypothetical protein